MLSIQDEMENVFVWEHLQAYEGPSKGAWLGMSFNPKGTKRGTRFYPLGQHHKFPAGLRWWQQCGAYAMV